MKPSPTLLRACGKGDQLACDIARRLNVLYAQSELTFANVVEDDDDHPNKLPFEGTLLLTDVPSDKPPHGSEGHRIFVSKHSAISALQGLVGQAVNYQPQGLNAHASRHKVGVITKAWMDGNKVKTAGFIWQHDFPESKVLKGRKDLGMSMELANVLVRDEDSDVWKLDKFDFTGATILKKDAAAYTQTSLAAQAAATVKGETMPKPNKEERKKVAAAHKDTGQSNGQLALMTQAISASLGQAVQNAMTPVLTEIKASNERFVEGLEELKGLHLINAAASNGNDDDDDDEIVLHAAKEDDASASDAEEEEMEAAEDDASASDAEMEANGDDSSTSEDESSSSHDGTSNMAAMEDLELEDPSEEPGEVNKKRGNKNKGSKTTVTDPPTQGEHFKGNVAKGRLHSAAKENNMKGGKKPFPNIKGSSSVSIQAAAVIGELQATVKQLKRQIRAQGIDHQTNTLKLRKKLKQMQAQTARFAEMEGRRSRMSNELVSIGEKVGVDFGEARMAGQKYSVRAFDSILAAAEQTGVVLQPFQKIAIKMMAEQEGILDEGAVDRNYGRA